MNPLILTPALSHPKGEGESHSVSFEFASAGSAEQPFEKAKMFDCCSLSRLTGEGQGEGREVRT